MQIIIPMTGYGSRFVKAGYRTLKPFIEVAGMPAIYWIVRKMFPGEDDILFVCRKEHLRTLPYAERLLREAAPNGRIFAIEDWTKRGPVFDVLRAAEAIRDEGPCIVNYCDFYAPWDWPQAERALLERGCDGAVVAFTGFQPCLVPEKNVYASCRCDERGDLLEIREKYCFARDKFQGLHSTGTYYFRTGALLKKYYKEAVEAGLELNGEYYASLPYGLLVRDGLNVWVPVFGKWFYTWGTPEDMEEFEFWIRSVRDWAAIREEAKA